MQGGRGQEEKRKTEEQKASKEGGRRARVPVRRRSCRRKRRRKKGPGGHLMRQQRKKSGKTKQHHQKEGARVLRKKGIFVVGGHGGSERSTERKQCGLASGGAGHGRRPEREEFDCMQELREGPNAWSRKEEAEFNICKEFLESHGIQRVFKEAAQRRPRSSRGGHSLIGNHRRSGSRS